MRKRVAPPDEINNLIEELQSLTRIWTDEEYRKARRLGATIEKYQLLKQRGLKPRVQGGLIVVDKPRGQRHWQKTVRQLKWV